MLNTVKPFIPRYHACRVTVFIYAKHFLSSKFLCFVYQNKNFVVPFSFPFSNFNLSSTSPFLLLPTKHSTSKVINYKYLVFLWPCILTKSKLRTKIEEFIFSLLTILGGWFCNSFQHLILCRSNSKLLITLKRNKIHACIS